MAARRSNRNQATKWRGAKCARRAYDVFLSHATKDKWIARILCEKVESLGASTFRDDRDIDGGEKIPESIRLRIRNCDEFAIVLSPASVNRPWILVEFGIAFAFKRRIVPFLAYIDSDPIPDMLKDVKAIDLNELDNYLDAVRKRIAEAKR